MAASSVLSQIEDLIGDVTETTAVDEWASDTAREVINILPQDMLWSVSTTITDSGSGATLTTAKFLYAHKSGYPANEIKPEMRARATDNDSIYLATVQSPAFYRETGKIYVIPSGGSVVAVAYPAIAYNDPGVTGVPDDVKHLVIYGTAVKGRLNQLKELREDIVGITSPTYAVATITLTAIPTIADLSISATPPAVVSAPSFSYADISSDALTLANEIVEPVLTIGDMGAIQASAPTYDKPTLVLGPSPTLTALDLTSSLTAPTLVNAPAYNYIDVGDIATIADTNVSLGTAPAYTGPTATSSVVQAETYIRTDEDIELANAELQKVSVELNKFQNDVANALNEFNEANAVYQAELQKAIQNARLDQERILAEIQIEQDNKRQDRLQNLQKEVQEYEAGLKKYSLDFQDYQTKINNRIQLYQSNEVQAKLEVWQKERSDDLNKYQLDVQNELNEFSEKNTKYQAEVGREMANFQKDIQKAMEVARIELQARTAKQSEGTSIKVQEKQMKLQKDIENAMRNYQASVDQYGSSMAKYQAEVQSYSAQVNTEVTKYTVNEIQKEIALWSGEQGQKLAKYGSDMQNNNSKFQSEFGVYGRKLDLEFQKHGTMMQELALLEKQYQQGLQTFVASYTLPKGDNDGQ